MVKSRGLNEGSKCSRNSWMSATDFFMCFIQWGLIQNLPAMLLGSTRLCNKKGKHSMFVVQATHVATGLFLMILTKPGPFLSISQKGKRLDRLLFFFLVFGSALQWSLGEHGNTGYFFLIAATSVKAGAHCHKRDGSPYHVDTEALTFVYVLQSRMGTEFDSNRGNKGFITDWKHSYFSILKTFKLYFWWGVMQWKLQHLTEFSFPDFIHYITAGMLVVLNLFQVITIYYEESVSRTSVRLSMWW